MQRFARSDGLEQWTATHDAALERAIVSNTRRIQSLDQDLRPIARGALGDDPSPAWRTILGALVVAAWDSARRMGGQRAACVGHVRGEHRAPFSSLTSALEFAVYRQPLLGMVPQRGALVEDRPQDVAARISARAAGIDMRMPRTSRVASSAPRGLAAVELRADVLRAIRNADVTALDFWLVVASDVGEPRLRARRRKDGEVDTAFVRRSGAELSERLASVGIRIEAAEVRERVDAARERLREELEARDLLASTTRARTASFAPPLLLLQAEGSAP